MRGCISPTPVLPPVWAMAEAWASLTRFISQSVDAPSAQRSRIRTGLGERLLQGLTPPLLLLQSPDARLGPQRLAEHLVQRAPPVCYFLLQLLLLLLQGRSTGL